MGTPAQLYHSVQVAGEDLQGRGDWGETSHLGGGDQTQGRAGLRVGQCGGEVEHVDWGSKDERKGRQDKEKQNQVKDDLCTSDRVVGITWELVTSRGQVTAVLPALGAVWGEFGA